MKDAKKYKVGLVMMILALLVGCGTPAYLRVPDALNDDSQSYLIKGTTGWVFSQKITFGGFRTDKIKKGWYTAFEGDFILRFQGAREKLRFKQMTPTGGEAGVYGVSRVDAVTLESVRDYFAVSVKDESYYAGTIIPSGEGETWDFIVFNPDGGSIDGLAAGFAINANGERIEILEINSVEGKGAELLALNVNGYEFIQNGEKLGAVSLLDKGRVWFRNGVDDSQQLVMSSLMSALLVRSNL